MRPLLLIICSLGAIWAQGGILRRIARISVSAPPPPPSHIRGKIIDGNTGEPLPGVLVRTPQKGTYTSEKGLFSLSFTGPETLTVFLPEYRILKVFIAQPQSDMVLRLFPLETETEPVQIIDEVQKETEAAVFVERMRSLEIGELYSQEQIAQRSTDFYVPNVLRRLPGVSLLSGRFLSIRGFSERYNAFAFSGVYPAWLSYDGSFLEIDQMLSTLFGKIEVRKFWTPELLGHFGGGLVDLQIPTAVSEGLQVGWTSEIDFWAIGRPFPRFRRPWRSPLPADFPSPATIQASENAGNPLPENFSYGQRMRRYTAPDTLPWALPGGFLTLGWGRGSEKWQVSLRASLMKRQLRSQILFQDGLFEERDGTWQFAPTYLPSKRNPVWWDIQGGGASWHAAYQPNTHHALSLEGLFTSITTQRIALEQGAYINANIITQRIPIYYPSFLLQKHRLFLLRPTWQLTGFQAWKAALQAGLTLQQQDIPQAGAMNYAQYPGEPELSYEKELYGDYEIYAQVWTSRSRARQGFLHPWVERRWETSWGWLQGRLGAWFSQEHQSFRSRQLGYMPDTAGGAPDVLDPAVYTLPFIRRVYDPEYILPGGWYLIERTSDLHNHRGRTTILAGYGWLRAALGRRWEALIGLRYEYWQRKLWHVPIATEQEEPLQTFQDAHLLPALLVKYRLAEKHSLRLGGNFTLIRPPLPSQVPLRFFDFMYAYYWSGDLTLSTARSYNAELRYEWLSDKDNLLAAGIFYKYLRNLPEIYMTPASFMAVFNYSNRKRRWGEVMGVELETRKTLWENQSHRFWSYLTLTLSESAL